MITLRTIAPSLALLALLAVLLPAQRVISSGFAGNGAIEGFMFKVDAINSVVIRSFDLNLDAGTWDIEVYRKTTPGSWVGSEFDPSAWTRIGSYEGIESAGSGGPTALPRDFAVMVLGGQTQAFYVTLTSGGGLRSTVGIGAGVMVGSDANLQVFSGVGKRRFFSTTIPQRAWNGRVHYYGPGRFVPSLPYPTLQSAINAAADDDAVVVAPGTYVETLDLLGKNIMLVGSGGRAVTIVDANGGGTVVDCINGEGEGTVLKGLTLTGGLGSIGRAGGISLINSEPTIEDCRLTGNQGGGGGLGGMPGAGGIQVAGGGMTLRLKRCLIDGNQGGNSVGAGVGAAGGIGLLRDAEIVDCRISGNIGGNRALGTGGAGGLNFPFPPISSGQCYLTRCEIEGNQGGSGDSGGCGALLATGGIGYVLDRCVLSGNQGGDGINGRGGAGGIACEGVLLELTNSIIHSNTGGSSTAGPGGVGGVLATGLNDFDAIFCTLSGNVGGTGTSTGSGGLAFEGLQTLDAAVVNTIVWGNTGISISELPATTNPAVVSVVACNVQGGWSGSGYGNFDADPVFTDAANGNFRLQAASPCVDAGEQLSGMTISGFAYDFDFDGQARPEYGINDVGADEVNIPFLPGGDEDFRLEVLVNGLPRLYAGAGSVVTVAFLSPGGTFAADGPVLIGQAFPIGSPPAGLGVLGLPEIHLDLGAPILFDGSAPTFLGPIVIGPSGLALNFVVPAGISNTTIRLQGLVLSTQAANGFFAASGAHDLVLW